MGLHFVYVREISLSAAIPFHYTIATLWYQVLNLCCLNGLRIYYSCRLRKTKVFLVMITIHHFVQDVNMTKEKKKKHEAQSFSTYANFPTN